MILKSRATLCALGALTLACSGLSANAAPSDQVGASAEQAQVTLVAVPGATSLGSAQRLLASWQKVELRGVSTAQAARSQRVAAQTLRAAAEAGTLQEQPQPVTVEGEQALANTSTQTFEAATIASSGTVKASAAGKDYMTYAECAGKGASNQPDGWFKNHWSWCQSTPYVMSYVVNGRVKGNIYFRSTLIGRGYVGTRKVTFDEYINEFYIEGSWPRGGTNLHLSMDCRGVPAARHCEMHGSKTIWLSKGFKSTIAHYTAYSSATGAKGSAKWSAGIFTPKYQTDSAGTEHGYTSGFRCDSASYLGTSGACIFDRVRGTFQLSRTDKAVDESAKHIYAAVHRSNSKTRAPSVLTRMVNKDKQKKNTNAALAACRKIHKTRPPGKDCDEYPFKSTRQGVAYAGKRFSVRYIRSGDNQETGRRLGAWMKSDRILDGDKFNVMVK